MHVYIVGLQAIYHSWLHSGKAATRQGTIVIDNSNRKITYFKIILIVIVIKKDWGNRDSPVIIWLGM